MVIVHDHRGYGLSGGWPRGDIDPWQQIHDWRWAITYLQELDGVDDEAAQFHGAEPARVAVNSTDPGELAAYHDADWDAFDHLFPPQPPLAYDKKVTVIDPDLQRAAFSRAGEPKQLVTYDGGHFAACVQHFEVTAGNAEKWFTQYLMAGR